MIVEAEMGETHEKAFIEEKVPYQEYMFSQKAQKEGAVEGGD